MRSLGRRPRISLTIAELVAIAGQWPDYPRDELIAQAPPGDGHTVLVLPALLTGDAQTARARDFLNAIGYHAEGWGLGVNFGPTAKLLDGARDRLAAIKAQGGDVSLVGYSMGGLFARWLARQAPVGIRQVITVCSPFREPAHHFFLPVEGMLDLWPGPDLNRLARDIAEPLPLPTTAIFSRNDGVVHWESCVDTPTAPDADAEITGPHMLIMQNPAVMRILAERLARQTSQGEPLREPGDTS